MELATFFVIGGVINAVVLLLFALWFRREWHRSRKQSAAGGTARACANFANRQCLPLVEKRKRRERRTRAASPDSSVTVNLPGRDA